MPMLSQPLLTVSEAGTVDHATPPLGRLGCASLQPVSFPHGKVVMVSLSKGFTGTRPCPHGRSSWRTCFCPQWASRGRRGLGSETDSRLSPGVISSSYQAADQKFFLLPSWWLSDTSPEKRFL